LRIWFIALGAGLSMYGVRGWLGSGFRCTEYEVSWVVGFDVKSTRLSGFWFSM